MKELIKLSSFGNPDIELIIQNGELFFNSKKLKLNEIIEFKYGIESIQFDMFSIGRKYSFSFRFKEDRTEIIFKSYLGLSKEYFNELFNKILSTIWKDTAVRLIDEAIDKIINKGIVEIGKCQISEAGINYNGFLITWDDLSYQKNYDRLTINSRSNSKIWTNLYYLKEYNIDVLTAILDWIYTHNGIAEIANYTPADRT